MAEYKWWDSGLENDNTIVSDSSVIKNNNVDQGYVFPKTSTTGDTSINSNKDSNMFSGLGNIFGGNKAKTSNIDLSKANGMMLQKDANGGYIVPSQFNDKIKSGEMVIGADGKLTDLTASAGTGILGSGISYGDAFQGLGTIGGIWNQFGGQGKKEFDKTMESSDAKIKNLNEDTKTVKQNRANKQAFYNGFASDSNKVMSNKNNGLGVIS